MTEEKLKKVLKIWRRRMAIAMIVAYAVMLLIAATGQWPIEGNTVSEVVPEANAAEIWDIPDPCGLDSVICPGEKEAEPAAIAPVFDQPCIFGPYAVDCTTEAFDALTTENKVIEAAQAYGIRVEDALAIADCESSFNSRAQNPRSTAKGVYQFTDPTWKWIKAQGHQFDADENIKQFMIWYPVHPEWWVCK